MQWIVGHKLKLYLVIYIEYWNVVDSLQQDIESTLELDFEGANTPMGLNGPCSELKYHDDMVYEGWIDFKLTLVHKNVSITM